MEQRISVGNQIQVYNKGEAYSGCLVAFGKVTLIDEDLNNNKCYQVEGYEDNYNEDEYDIVLVSLANPFFAKQYMVKNN